MYALCKTHKAFLVIFASETCEVQFSYRLVQGLVNVFFNGFQSVLTGLLNFAPFAQALVAVALAKVASDVKAADIRVLFVKPLVYWTRFFIIATAFSRPQIDAIGSRIRDLAEKQYGKVPSGDSKPNSWTLLDFGDVVIHIFLPQQRAFYNLEEFYANATLIELPFEN